MRKFRLINYFDVWGNARDGWEINNQCEEAILEFDKEWPSEQEVVAKLKEIGFFKKHVRMNMVHFCREYMDIYVIEQKRDYKPVCALEPIYE